MVIFSLTSETRLLPSLKPFRFVLMWTPITKTQFQVFFRWKIFITFFLKDLPKTVNHEAYHWRLLAKIQNISEKAKITKEMINFCNQNRHYHLRSVINKEYISFEIFYNTEFYHMKILPIPKLELDPWWTGRPASRTPRPRWTISPPCNALLLMISAI